MKIKLTHQTTSYCYIYTNDQNHSEKLLTEWHQRSHLRCGGEGSVSRCDFLSKQLVMLETLEPYQSLQCPLLQTLSSRPSCYFLWNRTLVNTYKIFLIHRDYRTIHRVLKLTCAAQHTAVGLKKHWRVSLWFMKKKKEKRWIRSRTL